MVKIYRNNITNVKYLSFCLIFIFIVNFSSAMLGTGTSQDPYQITNCEQLQNISNDLNANYKITSDIDCSDTKNWNGGQGFIPIGSCSIGEISCEYPSRDFSYAFTGVLDGSAHLISNLYINRPDESNIGLFAVTSNESLLINLKLENVSVAGGSKTGALVGYNEGEINKVYISGVVDGFGEYQTGGVIGAASMFREYPGKEIRQVHANMTVKGNAEVGCFIGYLGGQGIIDSYCEGEVIGGKNIGYNSGWGVTGFAGMLIGANSVQDTQQTYGYLKNVYSNVIISTATPDTQWSGEDAAGLSGRTFGSIDNSFSISTFTCTNCKYSSNGISGYVYNYGTVENGALNNNFYYSVNNTPSICVRSSVDGETCTKINDLSYFKILKNQPLASWDFENTWTIKNGFPSLKWEEKNIIPVSYVSVDKTNLTLGESATFSINLFNNLSIDYSTGFYQTEYAGWILSDENGNVVQSKEFEKMNGSYLENLTVTPELGNYILTAFIIQYNQTYDEITGNWTTSNETILTHEAVLISVTPQFKPMEVKIISAPPSVNLPYIQNWFSRIWDFIVDGVRTLLGVN